MEYNWYFGSWFPTTTWGWALTIALPLVVIAFFSVKHFMDR